MSKLLSDHLRRAIRECGRSRYAISCETGVDQATLSRFMQGGGLTLDTVDKLMDVLNLEVRPRRKARKAK
jgi:Helix-turn-helix